MHYPCPNCGVAGNNFTCTNHIINLGPRVPIQAPVSVSTPPGTDPLIAEIARLNVENYRLREENQSLKELWAKLKTADIIDQFANRPE